MPAGIGYDNPAPVAEQVGPAPVAPVAPAAPPAPGAAPEGVPAAGADDGVAVQQVNQMVELLAQQLGVQGLAQVLAEILRAGEEAAAGAQAPQAVAGPPEGAFAPAPGGEAFGPQIR